MSEEEDKNEQDQTAPIKIASKDPQQRNASGGGADPGPGDMGAAPSTAPEPVDIPEAPTASQLVVKSSLVSGSQAGPAASNPSGLGTQEPPSTSRTHSDKSKIGPVASSPIGSGSQEPASINRVTRSDKSKIGPVASSPIGSSPQEPASINRVTRSHKSKVSPTASSPTGSNTHEPSTPTGGTVHSSKSKEPTGAASDKKVTRFRYHKRISVRTTGKTSPESVMSKVGKPSISPSTIDELDPKELLKQAGIKDSKHWRIRLRQTKRTTKDGKTTTQTKTAYRDSSGNHKPPNCKKCGKDSDQSIGFGQESLHPQIYVTGSPITAEANQVAWIPGHEISLKCNIDGYPEIQFSWFRLRKYSRRETPPPDHGEEELKPGDNRFIISNNALTIKSPTIADVGDYYCRVKTPHDDVETEKMIAVRAKPYIQDFVINDSNILLSAVVEEGKKLKIPCNIIDDYASDSMLKVTWHMSKIDENDMNEVIPGEDGIKIESTNSTSQTLIIDQVTKDHRRFYKCHVTNGVTDNSKVVLIRVKDKYTVIWPTVGIVLELVILIGVICIVENRKVEPDTETYDRKAIQM